MLLEGRELEAESSILDRHGRMTAEEESRKTKQEQDEGRHRPRFLGYMVMKVKPLSANRILANHNPTQDPNHRILEVQRSRFTHYYFYIRDEVLGPIIVRVARFFPFHAT